MPNLTAVIGRAAQGYRSRLQWSPIGNANPCGGVARRPSRTGPRSAERVIQDQEYEYGPIMFIAGYPLYEVVFRRKHVARASYIGGNVVFSWQTYARNQGLLAKGACTSSGPAPIPSNTQTRDSSTPMARTSLRSARPAIILRRG